MELFKRTQFNPLLINPDERGRGSIGLIQKLVIKIDLTLDKTHMNKNRKEHKI